ncbi:MAG: hypothetical protein MPN21_27540 [Thermoanaerobaculia bacterium]|nr:hypothetical protein [Thermoanaerobaculia bacterium]
MRVFLKILFFIGFTCLSINTVRLSYQLWFQPTVSVLDKYDAPVESEIRDATSIEALLTRFDQAHADVETAKANLNPKELKDLDRSSEEPFRSERLLRGAIQDWERQSNQIFKIRVYWCAGLLFLLVGVFAYKHSSVWIALSSLFVGFSEMVYWASPSYFGSRSLETERLLANKLGLGATSFLLLLLVAYLVGVFRTDESQAPNPTKHEDGAP